jgi:hypothetical protein
MAYLHNLSRFTVLNKHSLGWLFRVRSVIEQVNGSLHALPPFIALSITHKLRSHDDAELNVVEAG